MGRYNKLCVCKRAVDLGADKEEVARDGSGAREVEVLEVDRYGYVQVPRLSWDVVGDAGHAEVEF